MDEQAAVCPTQSSSQGRAIPPPVGNAGASWPGFGDYFAIILKEGMVVFFIALLFLLLLGALAVLIAVQNYGVLLSTNIHLTLLFWSLPGIPVLLLCVLGIFLGGLALYVIAARAARRDEKEIKVLRARIAELEKLSDKSPGSGLASNFAPSVVPLPGFSPGASLGSSVSPNQPGPAMGLPGPNQSAPLMGPSGPANQPAATGPGPSGPPNQWQPSANQLQNMSPSASGNTLPLPPRLFPPQQPPQAPQQMGGPRPPFPRS